MRIWLVLLGALLANALPADAQETTGEESSGPQPLPEAVVDAWVAAGAEEGWLDYGRGFSFDESHSLPEPDDLPAFSFEIWEEGQIAMLPAPAAPFGLDLTGTDVTDAKLTELAGLTNLQAISLSFTDITDESLTKLAEIPNLSALCLNFTKVSDEGMTPLADLPNLHTLSLRFTPVTDAGLEALAAASSLQSLDLSGSSGVSNDGLSHLAALTNLRYLDVGHTQVTDDGLPHLAALTNLHTLDLTADDVSDAGLQELAKLTSLQLLSLRQTSVTGIGLGELAALPNLYSLSLDMSEVTDEGLVELASVTSLQSLHVGSTQVTEEGVSELQRALPSCEIIGGPRTFDRTPSLWEFSLLGSRALWLVATSEPPAIISATRLIVTLLSASAADDSEVVITDEPLPEGIADNPTNRRCWQLLLEARAESSTPNDEEELLTELLGIEDAPSEFVAEAHMMLCDWTDDGHDEHFAALRAMDDVPPQIMAQACEKIMALTFGREKIEYCSIGLQCEDLPDELAAKFYVERGEEYFPSDVPDERRMALAFADADSALALVIVSDELRGDALELRARSGTDAHQRIEDYRAALAITDWGLGAIFNRLQRMLRELDTLCRSENDLELAIECMTEVINNRGHRERRDLIACAIVLRGELRKDLGDVDAFLAENLLILEGDFYLDDFEDALDRLTQHYLELGDNHSAFDVCTRAIGSHVSEPWFEVEVFETRGDIFMSLERYEQALVAYELMREKIPRRGIGYRNDLARAWKCSGLALTALNRADEAFEHFQSGINDLEADEDNDYTLLGLRIARAQLNRRLGNVDAAIQELEAVLELSNASEIDDAADAELAAILDERAQN